MYLAVIMIALMIGWLIYLVTGAAVLVYIDKDNRIYRFAVQNPKAVNTMLTLWPFVLYLRKKGKI